MTLHGYALTSDEAGQLSAISGLYELEGRTGGGIALRPTWGAVGQLLGWHDRLATLLAEREAELALIKRHIEAAGGNPGAPFDWSILGKLAELESENDRLRAELAAVKQ